jgi:urease accessory protein
VKARGVIVARSGSSGGISYPTLWAEPPLALRPTPDALFVAAAAAGPLGGDEVVVDVLIESGASLRVSTVGATIALAGMVQAPSRWCWHFVVEAGARLEFVPEPTVVASRAWHRSEIEVALADDAQLLLREEIIFGRHGEQGGRWEGRLDVRRAGEQILVQEHDLSGESAVDRGAYGLGGASAFGSLVEVGGRMGAPTSGGSASGAGWARMSLAVDNAVLGVAVATGAVELHERLDCAGQDPRYVL